MINKQNVDQNKYPEINGFYRHYKGGKYQVITLAKHSETEAIKETFKQLNDTVTDTHTRDLIKKLEGLFDENLVVYKSVHWGSVHARPLKMWFDTIKAPLLRFNLIKSKD